MKRILILSLLCAGLCAQAEAGTKLSNPFIFENVRLTLITEGLLRAEYAVDGRFHDDRTMFAWNRTSLCDNYSVEQLDSITYIISTPKMKVKYIADNYPFGIFNLNIEFDNAGQKGVWNSRKSAFPSPQNLRGAVATLDQVNGRCELEEGILSRDGFYLVDDTAKNRIVGGWLAPAETNHIQDYYIFIYGDDYKSALKSLGTISGKAPMNRKYMHGSWYCRFYNYTADDYRRIALEYREHDFPLDVMVLDMDWHTMDAKVGSGHGGRKSWTGYSWNRSQFPDPEALISEFKADGIAVTLNDHPADGVRPHEDCWTGFAEELGLNPQKDPAPLFNAADRKYMNAFFKHALAPHEQMGVAFWWMDWQQNYIQPFVRGTHTKHLPWLNHLYYDFSARKDGLRGNVFSRWGGLGSHRYPAQFSGDAFGTWETLAFEVEMTASSGNSGCFYWSHDIGGHIGRIEPEIFTRWVQFGALSSTLRLHSSPDSQDRRPWLWGGQATDAMRKAYHLRSELMPYIYTSLRQTHDEMLPFTRPMYIEYPKEEKAYQVPLQYLFGNELLAAPIVTPGEGKNKVASRKVWFPGDSNWYRFDTGEHFEGGKEVEIKAAIDDIPLFAKGGHIIPMQPYTQRMATEKLKVLRARVYPAEEGSSNTTSLYEDDGISTAYLEGECAFTPMTCEMQNGELILTIHPTTGSYKGQSKERDVVFEIIGLSEQAGLKAGKAKIVRDKGISLITVPSTDIRKGCRIIIENPYN